MGVMRNGNDSNPVTPHPSRYEIDPAGSRIGFRTRHMFGLAPVRGTFAIRGGTVELAESAGQSRIHAEIDAASFRTGNPMRDTQVRSARFLDAGRYPVLTFTAQHVDLAGKVIDGTLTVGEVTRPVRLTVTGFGATRDVLTARGSALVDRFDFGLTAARGLAGRRLDLSVEVRCQRR
jgi:polyisoprenoid-binding protein YceI